MSAIAIAVLIIVGPAVYATLGALLGRRLLHRKVQEGHNDVLVPMFLTAGVIYAVLLGSMVLAVWGSYDAAKGNAGIEAASLVPLYRSTGGMPRDVGEKMRHLTREYVEAVIHDEWPTQAATGKGSSKARRAIGDMFRAFGDGTITQEEKRDYPFIFQTFMQSVNTVTGLRNKRNIQANESVPAIVWGAAVGGAFVIISMTFLLYMERAVPHVIMASIMASLIGALLYVCFVLSHPFNGPLAISAEAFEDTAAVLDDVDKGN